MITWINEKEYFTIVRFHVTSFQCYSSYMLLHFHVKLSRHFTLKLLHFHVSVGETHSTVPRLVGLPKQPPFSPTEPSPPWQLATERKGSPFQPVECG